MCFPDPQHDRFCANCNESEREQPIAIVDDKGRSWCVNCATRILTRQRLAAQSVHAARRAGSFNEYAGPYRMR